MGKSLKIVLKKVSQIIKTIQLNNKFGDQNHNYWIDTLENLLRSMWQCNSINGGRIFFCFGQCITKTKWQQWFFQSTAGSQDDQSLPFLHLLWLPYFLQRGNISQIRSSTHIAIQSTTTFGNMIMYIIHLSLRSTTLKLIIP